MGMMHRNVCNVSAGQREGIYVVKTWKGQMFCACIFFVYILHSFLSEMSSVWGFVVCSIFILEKIKKSSKLFDKILIAGQ